jgi:hypothetical protein
MANVMLARLLVLFCCLSLQACTSTSLIYPAKTESSESSWVQKIKVGDKLEVLLKGEKVPVTLKVTEITPTEIKGENGVSVAIDKVVSVQEKHYSWVKNTFLTLGVLVVWAIIDIRNTVDDMDFCTSNCGSY